MPERVVWGLDIGQTAIRAVKLEAVKGAKEASVTITDTFFHDLGSAPDDPEYDDKMEEGLRQFAAEKHPSAQAPVVLSLLGSNALFRSFPVPVVGSSQLREVISYEAKQLIPYPLEEVIWDYQPLGVNEDSGEIQIALLCCLREKINALLEKADGLGIPVVDIQVAPLALINFCRYDFYEEGRYLLLDCGARTTDFVIFDESVFWLRTIPVCGNDITKVLMNKFGISFEEAEQLKTNMDDPKQAQRVFRTVEPTMRNLAAEAQRSIGFYRSTKRDATISELLLVGNSFLLEGADQYMADSLGYGARTMDLPQNIAVAPGVDEDELFVNRQVYGIAVGLALQGLGLAHYGCSLLPEERKLAKVIKGKEVFGWIAAALVLVTVVCNAVFTNSRKPVYDDNLKEIKRVMGESDKRYKEYNEKLKEFKPAQNVNAALVDMEKGRGMLEDAVAELRKAIELFNEGEQKVVNKKRLDVTKMDEFERNARDNVRDYAPSKRDYDTTLDEMKKKFAKDFDDAAKGKNPDATKKEMEDNLELQVLRRVLLRHQRCMRTFISTETYAIAYASKTEEDGKTTWTVDEESLKKYGDFSGLAAMGNQERDARKNAAAAPARPPRPGAKPDEEGDDEPEAAVAAEGGVPVVVVNLQGFIVSDSIDVTTRLRERLQRLKGFYLLSSPEIKGGFDLIRSANVKNVNAINLPAIYSPLPKEVNDDELGEKGELNRHETVTWEPAEETVHAFRARLLYAPKGGQIAKERYDEILKEAQGFLEKQAAAGKKPVTDEKKGAAAPAQAAKPETKAAEKAEAKAPEKPEAKAAEKPEAKAEEKTEAKAEKAEEKPAAPAPAEEKKAEDEGKAAPAAKAEAAPAENKGQAAPAPKEEAKEGEKGEGQKGKE